MEQAWQSQPHCRKIQSKKMKILNLEGAREVPGKSEFLERKQSQ